MNWSHSEIFIVEIGPCTGRNQNAGKILGSVFRGFFDGKMKQSFEIGFILERQVDPMVFWKRLGIVLVAALANLGEK